AGLPLVAYGLRGGDRVRAARDGVDRHLDPAQARPGRAAMSRRLSVLWLHAALIALAALTVAPMVWMVSASFMRPGESNNLPPPLLPATPSTEHYVALFTRLDLFRNM